jgi:hypothetical protein
MRSHLLPVSTTPPLGLVFALVAAFQAGCTIDNGLKGSSDANGAYNPPDLSVPKQEDSITQVTVPAVDVLFVVDNSGSMAEEQRSLRENFALFMQYFSGSGLDYHVGVTSTDCDSPRNKGMLIEDDTTGTKFIDDSFSAADATRSFQQRANLGTNGSSDERGKDAAWAALVTNSSSTSSGFIREDADLSIIVISDERDWSRDVTVNEFSNWMTALKPHGHSYFSSVVGLGNSCINAERGTGYLEVTANVGGIEWDICSTDYASLLDQLGLQAAGLKNEFFLSLVPVEDSIEVSVTETDGTETVYSAGTDWEYSQSRNSIAFNEYIPSPLAVVHITYDVLSTAGDPSVEVTDTATGADSGS